MKFSIIIPAYNEESYLPGALDAINAARKGLETEFEVIVVDNESLDRTEQIAKDFGAKVILETVHNIGKVRNTGASNAAGDVLIFIDADTLVPESLLQKIAGVMENEKCLGGAVDVAYQEFQRKWMKWYSRGWKFWGKVFNMKQGAAQFCRKSVFLKLGGYDETLYIGEDIEFYWRLTRFARKTGGYLSFIESPKVLTSSRRFDKMSLWKTLLLTHPFFILLTKRRKAFWKDWYEKAVR
ncbi:MAG TPA: glycosyltransferase [Pyrinomonadaceae bacterium]|nr:glycosyltransferase [Pyrinomonadaceae bacterium]